MIKCDENVTHQDRVHAHINPADAHKDAPEQSDTQSKHERVLLNTERKDLRGTAVQWAVKSILKISKKKIKIKKKQGYKLKPTPNYIFFFKPVGKIKLSYILL